LQSAGFQTKLLLKNEKLLAFHLRSWGRPLNQFVPNWHMEEAFLPFVRTDRYGEGGWAPQPLWERCRLAVLAVTLLPLRLLLTICCVAGCYLTVRIATAIQNEIIARRVITFFGKMWSRLCLFCLGFVHIRWVKLGQAVNPRGEKRRPGASSTVFPVFSRPSACLDACKLSFNSNCTVAASVTLSSRGSRCTTG